MLSPALLRRSKLVPSVLHPRSYTVEAICAIAHPEPTHALAGSTCMTHLLTGSQDGYIRDYDVFAAVNGKTFLTAPQRAHCQVVEGTMKSGQLRTWWENPAAPAGADDIVEDTSRSPATSLAMHSDALWALAGTEVVFIIDFTSMQYKLILLCAERACQLIHRPPRPGAVHHCIVRTSRASVFARGAARRDGLL